MVNDKLPVDEIDDEINRKMISFCLMMTNKLLRFFFLFDRRSEIFTGKLLIIIFLLLEVVIVLRNLHDVDDLD